MSLTVLLWRHMAANRVNHVHSASPFSFAANSKTALSTLFGTFRANYDGDNPKRPHKSTPPARWGSDPHSWWRFEQRCDIESWASVGPAVRILPCATLEERRKKTRPHKWRQSLIFLEIKILVLFRELVRTVEPTLESMYIVAWYVNTCMYR